MSGKVIASALQLTARCTRSTEKALLESGAIPDDCVQEIATAIPQTRSAVKFRPHSSKQCWVRGWRAPEGKLFIHIFTHSNFPYPYDWIAQHFFTGSIPPSDDLLTHYDRNLRIAEHWRVAIRNLPKLGRANMDANKSQLMPLLAETYGANEIK